MDAHPLKVYRERHQPPLSQEALANLLKVSRVTLARWETGVRQIGPKKLSIVSERTGISPSALRPDLAKLMEAAE